MSDGPVTLIHEAYDALQAAAELLFEAADLLSDWQAEYHGDRGMGVPAKNPRIERLYALSNQAGTVAHTVQDEMWRYE